MRSMRLFLDFISLILILQTATLIVAITDIYGLFLLLDKGHWVKFQGLSTNLTQSTNKNVEIIL